MVACPYCSNCKCATLSCGKDLPAVPNMGWFSVISDQTNAAFGLWKTKAGMQPINIPAISVRQTFMYRIEDSYE